MSLNKRKALSANLILKILISSGSLGSSAILAKTTKVQNLKEYQGFLTHCELVNKNPSSDDSLSHTVRHLFKLSEKKSCADAEKFLKSRSFIVLRFAKLENLTPFSEFKNVTDLSLGGNEISDLSPLAHMPQLQKLDLGGYMGGNLISDLRPLRKLARLEELILNRNLITDVSPLKNLTNLRVLNLSRNKISHISSLSSLSNLVELHLWSNNISDIKALKHLHNLEELNLNNNRLTDISPLKDLTTIKRLWLRYNKINDISPISKIRSQTELLEF